MFVALEARSPCLLCGCQIRFIMCGSARISKRSVRVETSLGGFAFHRCPECGTEVGGSSVPMTPYQMCPKDAAKVSEYRQRKWGVSGAPGPLVEGRRVV